MSCPSEPSVAGVAPPRVSRVRFFTTPCWPSKTVRQRVFTRPAPTRHPKRDVWVSSHLPKPASAHHNVALETQPHNVVALQSPGYGSTAPWAGEPDPGASTIRRRQRGTGLNKMRSPTKHGPIRPWVGMGGGHVVTRSDGATSVLSHPFRVHFDAARIPRVRPRALRRGGRTLGFGVPPRCGEEPAHAGFEWLPRCGEKRRTAGRASIAKSLIRSFFDGWRHPVCDSSYSGSLRINAWAERRLHNAAWRNQRWAVRRRLIWTVAGSR